MKSFVKGILFLSVTILYVVSTMGFGVHRCTSDGSASIMLLFGNAPCAYAHSHGEEGYHLHTCDAASVHEHHDHEPCEEHDHHGQEHHHTEDCCSTDVYVVTHDQTLTDDNNFAAPLFPFDAAFINYRPLIVEQADFTGYKEIPGSVHGALHKSHLQASFCVFRV